MERTLRKPLPGVAASLPRSIGLLACLVGLLFPTGPLFSLPSGHSLLQSTVVSIDPASANVAVGETVTVDVLVEDVSNLDYVEMFYLVFDPDLLEVVDTDPDTDGVQIEPGTFFGAGATVWDNEAYQQYGEIEFSQGAPDEPVSGSGVLAKITFRGKAAGTSAIEFSEILLEDADGYAIDAEVEEGSVTVTGEGEAPTPTGTPTSASEATATSTPGPTPTSTHTSTPGPTPTSTHTSTSTPTPTSISEDTPAPTHTPASGPTPTATTTPTPAPPQTSTPVVGAQGVRVLQVWPDRIKGVSSGLLESSAVYIAPQILPFGVYRTSGGDVVQARTYLHFPVNVFPPGTEILRATLHVHVDGISNAGEAAVGAYRVLGAWAPGEAWGFDPAAWPPLLIPPIVMRDVHLDAVAPAPTVTVTESSGLLLPKPAGHGLVQTNESTPTPAGLLELTPTPPDSPLRTPVFPLSSPGATVELESVAGTWLTWDVTVLMWAWLSGDAPDDGLALAPAPDPDASPEMAGSLLLASWITDPDIDEGPYIIAEFEVHPVTSTPLPTYTPTATSMYVLPYAGDQSGWGATGWLFVGAALLILGLVFRRSIKVYRGEQRS